jgi:hypothetical protein
MIQGGHPDEVPLTTEEKRAISRLKSVAKIWPESLWLFSASGSLCVMRYKDDGSCPVDESSYGGGVMQEYIVDHVDIENDGGDW